MTNAIGTTTHYTHHSASCAPSFLEFFVVTGVVQREGKKKSERERERERERKRIEHSYQCEERERERERLVAVEICSHRRDGHNRTAAAAIRPRRVSPCHEQDKQCNGSFSPIEEPAIGLLFSLFRSFTLLVLFLFLPSSLYRMTEPATTAKDETRAFFHPLPISCANWIFRLNFAQCGQRRTLK